MIITICGGGHLGHVSAGFFASQEGVIVKVLTRRPQLWGDCIKVTDPNSKVFNGHLECVTDNPEQALSGAEIVLLCLPGFSIEEELVKIKEYLLPNAAVGAVVSSTGFFFKAFEILPKTQPLFGFQRVPFISRTKEYGHSAELLGYKSSLAVAIEQCDQKETLRAKLETLYKCPISLLDSHYEVSLTNSNPLLHTSRLYTMWKDYSEGIAYDKNPQFYSDWTDEASSLLIAMDDEFQELLKALNVREGAVPTILDYYDSYDATSLSHKLNSIKAFQGLLSPMKEAQNGFVPDFESRYFTEDFPYGLKIIYDMAHKKGIKCPMIDKVYEWGMKMISNNMGKYDLRKLQLKMLDILIAIDKVCHEHNLCYYLDSGTILGAVRHKGFIPWDDDIDIAMPRSDYNKLIEHCNEWLPAPYEMVCYENNQAYSLNHGKIQDTTTTLIERPHYLLLGGLFVDVFPLDGVPSNKNWHNARIRYYNFLGNMAYLSRRDPYKHGRGISSFFVKIFQRLFPFNRIMRLDKNMRLKYSFETSEYVTNYFGNKRIPKSAYGTPKPIEFEGHLLMGPENPDVYLTATYGDYLTLPPIEKRLHHTFHLVDLEHSYKTFKP